MVSVAQLAVDLWECSPPLPGLAWPHSVIHCLLACSRCLTCAFVAHCRLNEKQYESQDCHAPCRRLLKITLEHSPAPGPPVSPTERPGAGLPGGQRNGHGHVSPLEDVIQTWGLLLLLFFNVVLPSAVQLREGLGTCA